MGQDYSYTSYSYSYYEDNFYAAALPPLVESMEMLALIKLLLWNT